MYPSVKSKSEGVADAMMNPVKFIKEKNWCKSNISIEHTAVSATSWQGRLHEGWEEEKVQKEGWKEKRKRGRKGGREEGKKGGRKKGREEGSMKNK